MAKTAFDQRRKMKTTGYLRYPRSMAKPLKEIKMATAQFKCFTTEETAGWDHEEHNRNATWGGK